MMASKCSEASSSRRLVAELSETADVLLAVLTQQKYNDAAVKQFFRAAVEADKPIIVVFNQCDLEADREYWPRWLATFNQQTGARPEAAYAIPHDRCAAEELRLPFYALGTEVPSPRVGEGTPRGLAASAASGVSSPLPNPTA